MSPALPPPQKYKLSSGPVAASATCEFEAKMIQGGEGSFNRLSVLPEVTVGRVC